MIEFKGALVSDEIIDKHFVCDLTKCKGACCVEGELGAPVDKEELKLIEDSFEVVKQYLTPQALEEIERQGLTVEEWDNEFSTPIINGKECVYAFYDQQNTLKCAFEQAYIEGKSDFKKPISCHLYPVRITKLSQYFAVNYDKWSICSDACTLGESLQVRIFEFLKEPLIRKFGEDWYNEFTELAKDYIEAQNTTK